MKTLITILLTICVVFCTEPKARKGYHAPYASVTDSFVQRHDTLFSVRNHLYTGNYYEVNGQKYAWGYSKDTMFYGWLENKFPIGTKFDIYNPEIFQHYIGIGVHKPVPVLDGIGAPTDTINIIPILCQASTQSNCANSARSDIKASRPRCKLIT